MSREYNVNLKSFPLIKLISAALLIVGAVLAYILSSIPEIKLFQIGGVNMNLIFGIPPLLSGIVLLIYAFITYYDVSISLNDDEFKAKSRKNEISVKKDDIVAVRVRDAGKFFIWFAFIFINFFFLYYGIECSLYFAANHHAGLLEFIIIPMLMIWFAGVILVLFPRKLVIILTKEKAILQKINHLPKDNSFEKMVDEMLVIKVIEGSKIVKSQQYLYRIILGVISLIILILTSILINIDGINVPLYDLGIFIPQFLLVFSVLTISAGLSIGVKQKVDLSDNLIRIEEETLTKKVSGKNFCWIKAKNSIKEENLIQKGFRKLSKYDMMLICVIFGQAFFLAFKFLWVPAVYLTYLDWRDLFFGILILVILFFYEFEILTKAKVEFDSEFTFYRELLVSRSRKEASSGRSLLNSFKIKTKTYFKDFRSLMKSDFKKQALKIGISSIAAIILITLSFSLLNFVLFIFI